MSAWGKVGGFYWLSFYAELQRDSTPQEFPKPRSGTYGCWGRSVSADDPNPGTVGHAVTAPRMLKNVTHAQT